MNLTNISSLRSLFYSTLEQPVVFSLINTPIEESCTLEFKTIKDFYSYLAGLFSFEPILGQPSHFMDPSKLVPNSSIDTLRQWNSLTTINGQPTFRFLPLQDLDTYGIAFIDDKLYGDRNTYLPIGDSSSIILDSKITTSILDIESFYNLRLRNRFYKGQVTFSAVGFYKKGYTFFIADRSIYIIVTAFKPEKSGAYSYSGLLVVKG